MFTCLFVKLPVYHTAMRWFEHVSQRNQRSLAQLSRELLTRHGSLVLRLLELRTKSGEGELRVGQRQIS